jgi:hypothetical protein
MPELTLPAASLSISFTSDIIGETGVGAVLKGEFQAEDNGGNTSFVFGGASPIFRIYKSSNIKSVRVFPSDGSVIRLPVAEIKSTEWETLIFTNQRTVGVDYPIKSGSLQITQFGNSNLGAIIQSSPDELTCAKQSTGQLDPIIGVCRVQYQTLYSKYQLNRVEMPAGFGQNDFTTYPVHIHLVGIL